MRCAANAVPKASWEQNVILAAIKHENLDVLEAYGERMRSPWQTAPVARFAADAALQARTASPSITLARYGILSDALSLAHHCIEEAPRVLAVLRAAGPVWTARRLAEAAHLEPTGPAPSPLMLLVTVGLDLNDPAYPRKPLEMELLHASDEVLTRLAEAGAEMTPELRAFAAARRPEILKHFPPPHKRARP